MRFGGQDSVVFRNNNTGAGSFRKPRLRLKELRQSLELLGLDRRVLKVCNVKTKKENARVYRDRLRADRGFVRAEEHLDLFADRGAIGWLVDTGRNPRDDRVDRHCVDPGVRIPNVRSGGVRDSYGFNGAHAYGAAQGFDLSEVWIRLSGECQQ